MLEFQNMKTNEDLQSHRIGLHLETGTDSQTPEPQASLGSQNKPNELNKNQALQKYRCHGVETRI